MIYKGFESPEKEFVSLSFPGIFFNISMGIFNNIRKKHPGRVLKTQDKILGKYDEYVDESGVRGELSKFSDLAGMFGEQANRSYLDTTEGASFSRMIEEAGKKRRDRLRQDVGDMNLTQEAYLAGLGGINEQEGSSMNQLVSGADARRRALRSQQMQALSQVLGGEQGLMGSQQARFGQSLGAASSIYGQGAQMQQQSNQALMNAFGGLAESIIPLV